MKTTVVYFSSCGLDGEGKPDPFFLQELPWLLSHFDRVVLCSYYGVADVTEPRPERISVQRPALGELRAKLSAPFSPLFWQELKHLYREGRLTPVNAAKLLLFTYRGRMLANWVCAVLRPEETATLYSFWMSYDGFAAALCKKRRPALRAIARAHHFDINREANPMNPYLMKTFIGEQLDAIYPISRDAVEHLTACASIPAQKLHVIALGSKGDEARERFPAPFYQDGVLRIVSCAAVIERKQIPVLIDALALWRGGRVRWMHIGGGPDEKTVRAYAAQKLGEMHNIEFEITGRVDQEQVQHYYAVQPFDVFVNTSRSEGVPVSIMEAMHAGVLVVAPRINGIPEMVDERFGWLYPPEGGASAVLATLEAVAALPRETAETMRAASQARWNEYCRSEKLLETLFPNAAKGGNRA
ncbi:MAG TPA: glycosyltransferase [Candidatus Limiplasma sp.]|mgnify:CR=1 FL=1|nr:glycosyltransferase [Candidatus Limiplasma sp.]HPS82631.1 glycosyltransferase [Candidatus Limiplasma sp.]